METILQNFQPSILLSSHWIMTVWNAHHWTEPSFGVDFPYVYSFTSIIACNSHNNAMLRGMYYNNSIYYLFLKRTFRVRKSFKKLACNLKVTEGLSRFHASPV